MKRILSYSLFHTILRNYPAKVGTAGSYRTFYSCLRNVNNTSWIPYKGLQYSSDRNGEASYEEVKEVGISNKKKVLLIDVREPEELRETGVIPGSINIPLGQVQSALQEMSNDEFSKIYGRDKPSLDSSVIFSCKSGRRSADAQAISQQLGYKNVKNYSGGWLQWEEKSSNK